MKIIFLQLSDLHIQDKSATHPLKIQPLVNSLHKFSPFDAVVVVISGDIAATGQKGEYQLAAHFVGQLKTQLTSKYAINDKDFKILMVPGNHDICYPSGRRPSTDFVRSAVEHNPDEYLLAELNNLQNFLDFADSNKCFFSKANFAGMPYCQLYTRKILHFSNGYMIEANLFNTAPFSCSNDDGLHFIPYDSLSLFNRPSNANISITVMHHSPDWFVFNQRKDLNRIMEQRSSIAFFGHEHMVDTQQILTNGHQRIVCQSGGAWQHSGMPNVCEFFTSVFDTKTNEYSVYNCSWNGSNFETNCSGKYRLSPKPLNGMSLLCSEEYLSTIRSDGKHPISENFLDYYTFLKLKVSKPEKTFNEKIINTIEELLEYIKSEKYIAIVGGTNAGKTTLLKVLFNSLFLEYTVLFCGTENITGKNTEKIIKELVSTTYGELSFDAYCSIPSSQKVILIDDLHRVKPKDLKKFLRDIKLQFGTIVVATDDSNKFDIIQTVRETIETDNDFVQLYLSRLYASKRVELIEKIVTLKNNCEIVPNDKMIRMLEQQLNSYKLGFSADIDFVVQFADYFCSHYSELDSSHAFVFSKVFEASIEKAISETLINRKENPGDIIVALSEVAFYLHFNKEYPISMQCISDTIKGYCEYYDNKYLTPYRFIQISITSGLLVPTASGDAFRFASKDHLAYFVAKALNRKYHDNNDETYLMQIVNQSCFGINGDILLFLTYLGENVNITRLLLRQAQELVKDWSEFNITNVNAHYLDTAQPFHVPAPDPDQRSKDLENQNRAEEISDASSDKIETLDLYDYDSSQSEIFMNQIIRSHLVLKTIARSLSAFISILPANDKKELVRAIYVIPNRIFGFFAEEVDRLYPELINDFISSPEEYKNSIIKSPEDLTKLLQLLSTQILLNFYLSVSQFAATSSTIDYIANHDYVNDSITYRLERLLFYENVGDWKSVVAEAESLYDSTENGILRSICKLCVRHLLSYANNIPLNERHRIIDKFLPGKRKEILISQRKNLPPQNV